MEVVRERAFEETIKSKSLWRRIADRWRIKKVTEAEEYQRTSSGTRKPTLTL